MVNAHWLIAGLWSKIKGWLDPFVQQKISICGSKESIKKCLIQHVDESVLEVKYGGTRPNITQDFFPPKFIN